MKKLGIGFENFRRFKNFPLLELGPITFMVGRNNSGKSTMVKALLLTFDYLQNNPWEKFAFDNKILEDANIVTFGRAKNKSSANPTIQFSMRLDCFDIEINLSGKDDDTKAQVNFLYILDPINGYSLEINFLKELSIIRKTHKDKISDETENVKLFQKELEELKVQLASIDSKTSNEALKIYDKINSLEKKIEKVDVINQLKVKDSKSNYNYELEYPIEYQMEEVIEKQSEEFPEGEFWVDEDQEKELYDADRYEPNQVFHSELYKKEWGINDGERPVKRIQENTLKEVISTIIYYNNIQAKKLIEERKNQLDLTEEEQEENDPSFGGEAKDYNQQAAFVTALVNDSYNLIDWMDNLVKILNDQYFYYLAANPTKQSALFGIRDKNNSLSQAIHDFKQSGIQEGDYEYRLVTRWMKEFEIGDNFNISFIAGEAYEFNVEKNNEVNSLADKGMGSLQAMMLLLRTASLINYHKTTRKKITMLIEEPELNLHPALQSKLTEFFHEVYRTYDFNFIIETHSEYMIRKAQLLALEEDYISNQEINPNPFKVVYFHMDEGPYEMEFNEQGKFNRDFGKGFYDEASSMTMSLIKEIRKKQ